MKNIKNNITQILHNNCVGCFSCKNKCPKNAISFNQDEEGFFYPELDDTTCINCGLCLSVCPLKSYFNYKGIQESNAVFGATNKNENVLENSSSGGLFYALATYVLEQNGIVFGAKFDSNFNVVHSYCSDKISLKDFQGSKYVQSYIGNSYTECKNFLEAGKTVLFTGTPCQIAGLNSFLGKKYEKLITADIICHGVPSPKLWENYLQYRKEQFQSEINNVNFRNKKYGWEEYSLSLKFTNSKESEYCSANDIDSYMNLFLDETCSRESCYHCFFKGNKHCADFSLGDFWGAREIVPELYNKKGVSLLFCHSEKAKSIFNQIVDSNLRIKQLSEDDIVKACTINSCYAKSVVRPKNRAGLKSVIKDANVFFSYNRKSKTTVGILNHVFSNNNYGALLVAFAMETLVQEWGYNPVSLYFDFDKNKSEVFSNFRNNNLHVTQPLNYQNIRSLNNLADTFIVGSDQVWRNWWNDFDIFKIWFCSFANYKKKLIAYAASFGRATFDEAEIDKAHIHNLLSSFSAISSREASGVHILENEFNIKAKFVCDPTLLVDRKKYEQIRDVSSKTKIENPFITVMIFPGESSDTDNCHNAIKAVASDFGFSVKNIFGESNQRSIPDWLYCISKSKFNIIDSYHGLLFSLIFHQNFVCITNAEGGNERFYSILKVCGLENKLLDCTEISKDKINTILNIKIDWDRVEERLKPFKKESREFLEKALHRQVAYNSKIFYQNESLNRMIKNTIKKELKTGKRIMKKIIRLYRGGGNSL